MALCIPLPWQANKNIRTSPQLMCHGQNSLRTELLAHREDYVQPFGQSIKLRIRNALDIALHFAPLLCLTKTSSQQLFQEISQPKLLLQLDFLGPTGRTV